MERIRTWRFCKKLLVDARQSWDAVLSEALRRASDAPVSRSLNGPIRIPTEALKGSYWPCQGGPDVRAILFPTLLENSTCKVLPTCSD